MVGWAMLVLLFAGIALLMSRDMPVKEVVAAFAVATGAAGWIWVAANLITKKG